MAKPKIPRHLNRENLIKISNILIDVEHFIFFGGLLGLVRDGDIIEGDDDIDIYVSIKNREQILTRLESTDFEVDLGAWPNKTPYFLQASRFIDGIKTIVEFYFYEDEVNSQYVRDRWNFLGSINKKNTHILVPKHFLFPVKKTTYFDTDISFPANPEKICEFLYGRMWRAPLTKSKGYYTLIVNNKPHIFTGLSGKILYKVFKTIKKCGLY